MPLLTLRGPRASGKLLEDALSWTGKHGVKLPEVKPKGCNPLDLHTSGIPHLFILEADVTLVEE